MKGDCRKREEEEEVGIDRSVLGGGGSRECICDVHTYPSTGRGDSVQSVLQLVPSGTDSWLRGDGSRFCWYDS